VVVIPTLRITSPSAGMGGWTAYTTSIATQASIDQHRDAFEAMVLAMEPTGA